MFRTRLNHFQAFSFYALPICILVYFCYIVATQTFPQGKLEFLVLNFMLIGYLIWQVLFLAIKERWRVLIQPVVLASLVHFTLAYFIPNLRYFSGNEYFGSVSENYKYLNQAMWAILLALFSMWQGYKIQCSQKFGSKCRNWCLRKSVLQRDFQISLLPAFILLLISILSNFLAIKLGIFGISSNIDSLYKYASLTAWIKLTSDAGILAFLVLSLAFFLKKYRSNLSIKFIFFICLIWRIFIGFISGFKSQIVFPFIIIGVSYYVIRGKIPVIWLILAMVFITIAYEVIEPFRILIFSSSGFDNTSITAITNTLGDAASASFSGSDRGGSDYSTWDIFLARQDLMKFTAISFKFDALNDLPDNSPNFLSDIIIAPLNAYIPRFIWSGKGLQNIGYWYNVNILGAPSSTITAVGMGPVSYAYFAGGYIGVCLTFFYIGILQRLIFETFAKAGLGGIMVFLVLLEPLVMVPSNLGGMLAGFYRVIPFVLIAQYWLLHRRKKQRSIHNVRDFKSPSDG